MNKLSKTAKIISLLLGIAFWIILVYNLVYGCFIARSCFATFKAPEFQTVLSVNGITQGSLSLYSETGIAISRETLLWEYALSLMVSFIQMPILCYGIQLLRKILSPIAQQRPFSGTSGILKKLGWVSVILALFRNGFEWGLVYMNEHIMPVSELFHGSSITRVSFRFEPDMTFIMVAVVIFILAAVFRYGEELQQLSDETL